MAVPRNSNFTVYNDVQLVGSSETINSQAVTPLLADPNGDLLMVQGTALVTDGGTGYAKGCQFILTNATTGSPCVYLNKGTKTSCTFTLVTQA
jgi:hypothetical protein